MKKIALAAFSATALLALSACGGDATEEAPVVEETTMVEEVVTEPTDAATDAATDADAMATEEAPAEEAPVEEAPAE
jgi:hypothetical protein